VKEIKPGKLEDAQWLAEHWEKEVKALRMMNNLNQEHIVHFVTAFRRRKTSGDAEHYLIFEWADGGNLHTLWNSIANPTLIVSLVKDTLKQILGLAKALEAAHNLNKTGASYRHGDLKPENILVFSGNGSIGTLKIGDWGEAKSHDDFTEMRPRETTARSGTRRYEAPEVETGIRANYLGQSMKRRSRLSDIWAMGCITLEFVIWLLYGLKGLKKFNSDMGRETFYQVSIVNGNKIAYVNNTAVLWMERMAQDPRCRVGSTAIGDLLEIVQTALLVVKLPRKLATNFDEVFTEGAIAPMGSSLGNIPSISLTPADPEPAKVPIQRVREAEGPARCLSSDFRIRVEHIYEEDENTNYWYTSPVQMTEISAPNELSLTKDEGSSTKDDWKFYCDNVFARGMFASLRQADLLTRTDDGISLRLCSQCRELCDNIFSPGFSMSFVVEVLKARAYAKECDFCVMLWQTVPMRPTRPSTIEIERKGPFLRLRGQSIPCLSIVRTPNQDVVESGTVQIGFAELPNAGSATHLGVLRHWLQDCDSTHACRAGSEHRSDSDTRMPIRLIDVGSTSDSTVRLWETSPNDTGDWVALSHRWGTQKYCTTPENVQQHLNGIDIDVLPATFRDAVKVTRALGLQYLWIDSLCIIQGPYGDSVTEGKRLEETFGGANCVIAASCASDHYSGFLNPRRSREFVGMCGDGKDQQPFYICQNIDNFQGDVLDGALHSRAWLLQEHALARRTLFFTENQTYFECGNGVRCETSTKLRK
jgi:serine/threonine protein kinase